MNEMDEAREIHGRLLPMVLRVMGPDSAVTRQLQDPRFFEPDS